MSIPRKQNRLATLRGTQVSRDLIYAANNEIMPAMKAYARGGARPSSCSSDEVQFEDLF